jgi:hypothetical protein
VTFALHIPQETLSLPKKMTRLLHRNNIQLSMRLSVRNFTKSPFRWAVSKTLNGLICGWQDSTDDPFPDFEGMAAYAKKYPTVWEALLARLKNDEYVNIFSSPHWVVADEIAVEGNLKCHFNVFNFAFWKTSLSEKGS